MKKIALLIVLICISVFLFGNLKIHFIDVGQGDAILIQTPEGKNILIDGGPPESVSDLLEYLHETGASTFSVVIATHPHADHISGLIDVFKIFKVEKVYMPKVSNNTKTFKNFLLSIQTAGLKITTAKEGILLEPEEGITLQFLSPTKDKYKDLNNYSVVIRLTYLDFSILLTGDAEKEAEEEILQSGSEITSNGIKLGHHGSSSSSRYEFIEEVNPAFGVIMCGLENRYGHPHLETVATLEELNIFYFRTDTNGDIRVESDGIGFSVYCEKGTVLNNYLKNTLADRIPDILANAGIEK